MSRSFLSTVVREAGRAARLAEQHKRQAYQSQMRALREAERAQKAYQRAQASNAREQQRLYVESRTAEVESQNEALEQTVSSLSQLLVASLGVDSQFKFDSLVVYPTLPPLDLGDLAKPLAPPNRHAYMPAPPHWTVRWLPWVRNKYAADWQAGERLLGEQMVKYNQAEAHRQREIDQRRSDYALEAKRTQDAADQRNAEVRAFQQSFEAGEQEAVTAYFKLVVGSSIYPDGFPQTYKIFYAVESKQLLVECDLPEIDGVIPLVKSYKYVKNSDTMSETARPENQRRALYSSVVSQTVLRGLHECFAADRKGHLESIVFNGYVSAIAPGTGRRVRPCLVTVRTTRDVFETLDLARVDPMACLRTLNASVSQSPAELSPVRPILEFDMNDPRFIAEADVLSTLDQRPNLMELTPGEFESLITNLFEKMGLETRQTQASRDGGVDCVAYDPRPILGGKVVIQAKRYKHHVGVSAVRDLFGTIQNEGASKGILVTTSGYGKASFEFANGKPIELLGGSNLLYLLKEHAGIEAKIVPPAEWKDPEPDSSSAATGS